MRRQNHLVIFLKAPRVGQVKTRLARDLGPVRAWMMYRRLCGTLIRRLGCSAVWRTWLYVSPDIYAKKGGFWPLNLPRHPQGRGDLGGRMQRAFDGLPPGPVVIVGGDIPDICRADIRAAFDRLCTHDMVFGPAEDGGYWLVGMRRAPRILRPFTGVRWSTAQALRDTLANLPAERQIAFLRTLNDIDESRDLRRREWPLTW
ncbi:TIGR04282 family arsenosugar biosynthesis glycosyltransferase [Luteithermobacter gelatinilyticus]|uniref:TIGR04282 family arsenosugar biosynthesis glycosyltransferase n=1 Tax=Luteithermobacter gelatinilyticus TaxID=2582913 RepID=UPI001106B819|nr:TIGR04282 family arsenosugar biosynthesis glycosyltransferase [Luteithermobacter gelatinilyticus]